MFAAVQEERTFLVRSSQMPEHTLLKYILAHTCHTRHAADLILLRRSYPTIYIVYAPGCGILLQTINTLGLKSPMELG